MRASSAWMLITIGMSGVPLATSEDEIRERNVASEQ